MGALWNSIGIMHPHPHRPNGRTSFPLLREVIRTIELAVSAHHTFSHGLPPSEERHALQAEECTVPPNVAVRASLIVPLLELQLVAIKRTTAYLQGGVVLTLGIKLDEEALRKASRDVNVSQQNAKPHLDYPRHQT